MRKQEMIKKLLFAGMLSLSLAGSSQAAVDFDINLVLGDGLTASQQVIFSTAEAIWESFIVSYIEQDVSSGQQLTIRAYGKYIDGENGTLGQAGCTDGILVGSFAYATKGIMEFDTADLATMEANGTLLDVIVHEMAHVIGFGTLWSSSAVGQPGYQELYVSETGQYTGAAALAAYQAEFDSTETWVPVELDGGDGTANAHWDETWAGGVYELMTGYLNAPTFISNTTIASFQDIGYNVSFPTVPEPTTLAIWGAFGGLGMIASRRRRKAA